MKKGISRSGWLAIGLAILGGIVALLNEALRFRRGEELDWGHVALAVGVPAFIFAIVGSGSKKQP